MPTDTTLNPPQDAIPAQPEDWAEAPADPGLLDLLLALAERKRFILAMACAGALIMTAVAFLLPPMYTATTTIMPPQQQQSMASALLGQLGPLAAVAAAGSNLGIKTPSDLYVAILGSRTIADDLIQKFDLRQIYDAPTISEARKVLADRSSFSTAKDPLIKISVEDRDPKRAAALANAYLDELYKQNSRLALTESAQRRLFFECQMDAQKKSLADAEAVLRATQERTGVLQVTAQVESIIQSMARLRAEIAGREVALSSLKSAATPQNPEVVREEAELAMLRQQLQKLEASNDPSAPGDPMIPTSRVPRVGLEYVRALRDLKYNETLFELLAKQYEAARIDEAKEAPIIQVVDRAVPPERKSWPPRAAFPLAGALICGILACLIAAVTSSRLRDPRDADKLSLLKRRLVG
ncbi:MAG TPA: Wzz/FepE/Etk N-terminal domain-containing protein [Bryobacteraceae bacterium]